MEGGGVGTQLQQSLESLMQRTELTQSQVSHITWARTLQKIGVESLLYPLSISTPESEFDGRANLRDEELPTSSGYLPVGMATHSRLFYAFYEASNTCLSIDRTPLMLWLNGGPGCSSLIGCFYELGPWIVQEDGVVHRNPWAWNQRCGILFVDSPAGTGFSVAESDSDIPRDQGTVSQHLEYALQYFMTHNAGFRSRPLFLAGESYAGKYLPALAYYILQQPKALRAHHLASQLAGIIIGNGFTDPRIQVQCHADVAVSFGLLDKHQAGHVQRIGKEAVDYVDREEWVKAHERRTALCNFIERTSGVPTLLDIRRTTKYHHTQDGTEFLAPFLNSPNVKAALKVEESADWVSCRKRVRSIMVQDTMKSTKWMVEAILRIGFPVLLYQGMYDVKDGPSGSEAWMRTLEWQGSSSFWKGERARWTVNGELAGYWRQGLNLTHVVLPGAGHQVPVDQPLFAQVMIETWMEEQIEKARRYVKTLYVAHT